MLSGRRFPGYLARGRGELARGEPYRVGGRTLTPIARVRSFVAPGGRFEFLAVDPVGVVEEADGSRRLIAIGGGMGRRIGLLALLFLPVVVYVVAAAIVRSVRRSRPARKRR